MAFLNIHDLQVTNPYGSTALRSVNLRANGGEVIAIIGLPGAGKSTLLRCINGTQRISQGKIVLDHDDITTQSQAELRQIRRRIGFVGQKLDLVARLSTFNNVLLGRLGYNHSSRNLLDYFDQTHRYLAIHNLERVNLLHRARQRADQLPDWEQRCVAIARAMAQEPKILLVDDPIANLGWEQAWHVMYTLAQMARADEVLTLINLQHVEFAKHLADRVIALAGGFIVYDGKPEFLSDKLLQHIYHTQPNRQAEMKSVHALRSTDETSYQRHF